MRCTGDTAEAAPDPGHGAGDGVAVAAALAVGLVAALALPYLTYDSWAWMVWARELAHLALDETGGPVMKPFPVLLVAPLGPFGDLAPLVWLTVVRSSYILCGWLAWRVGKRLGGGLAGVLAAVGVLCVPGLFELAVQGYSEPVFVTLALVAVLGLLEERIGLALAALALGGLIRSEEWPFLAVVALWAVRSGHVAAWRAALVVLLPPAIWLGIDWVAAGDAFRSYAHAAAGRGSGAKDEMDTLFGDLGKASVIGAGVAAWFGMSRKNRAVGAMLATSVLWVGLILCKPLVGQAIGTRYLTPAAALLAVCAGWGWACFVNLVMRDGRLAAAVACVAALWLSLPSLGRARDSVVLAERQVTAGEALEKAVTVAGGRNRVVAMPWPTVMGNIPFTPELAWKLGVPLSRVTTVWKRQSNEQLKGPAFLFSAPDGIIGPPAAIPRRFRVTRIGVAPPWRVELIQARK